MSSYACQIVPPMFLSHFSLTAALCVFLKCCMGQKLTFTFLRVPQDTALVLVPGCMKQKSWLIFAGGRPLSSLPQWHLMLPVCWYLMLAKEAHTDMSPLPLAGKWGACALPSGHEIAVNSREALR